MKKIKYLLLLTLLFPYTLVNAKVITNKEFEDDYNLERAYAVNNYLFNMNNGFNISLKDLLISSSYGNKDNVNVFEIKKSFNINNEIIREYNELLKNTKLESFPSLDIKYIYNSSISDGKYTDIDENIILKHKKSNAKILTKDEFEELNIDKAYVVGEYLFNLDNGFNISLEDLLISATSFDSDDVKVYELKKSENINGDIVREYNDLLTGEKLNEFPVIKVKYIYSNSINGNEYDKILPYYDVIKLDDLEKEYTVSKINIDEAVSENGFPITYSFYNSDDCSGDELDSSIDVGNYSVLAKSTGNENILDGEICAHLKVVEKDITSSAAINFVDNDIVYTSEEITPLFTIYDGDNLLFPLKDYTFSYSDNINAGTGKINVIYKGNYKGSSTFNFEIKKRPLKVSVLNDSKIYDGEVYSSKNLNLCSVNEGYSIGVNDKITLCNTATVNKIVGLHDLFVTDFEITNGDHLVNDNYDIELIKGSVTIVQRQTTCTMNPKTKVYDGARLLTNLSCTNLVLGDKASITKVLPVVLNVADSTVVSVEKSDIVIRNENDVTSNYNITISDNGVIPLSVTGKSGVSSNNIFVTLEYDYTTYDDTEKKPKITRIFDSDLGVVLKENESYTYTYYNNVNPGTAEVRITFMGNYKGERTATFVIEPY